MKISFVIPAHNEEKRIAECLKSIIDLRDPWVHEIVVVDNASTDKTAEIAGSFPGVRVVREDRKGVTFARQKGLETITGDLYAAVDADSILTARWMDRAKWNFVREPDLAGLSGYYRYHDIPLWQSLVIQAIQWAQYLIVRYVVTHIQMCSAGNAIYNAGALRRAGGFNTDIVFVGEGIDVMMRLRKIGTFRFDPKLVILSSGRRLSAEGFLRSLFYYKFVAVKRNFFPSTKEGKRQEVDYR